MTNRFDDAEGVMGAAFSCDAPLARIVADKAVYQKFLPRTTIMKSETASAAIYVIIYGHAQEVIFSIDGRQILIEQFQQADVFGQNGLLSQQQTASEILSVDDVKTGQIRTDVFICLMENYSCIAIAMSRMLTARLARANQRFAEGASMSAAGRIHAELLRQAKAGTEMTIRPAPVLSLFAHTVNSTRETVSRTINALEKRGIIQRDEISLKIVAPHRLEELLF
jgi:CRP/FNR family transcriptional regulator, cyclic AMP receptor protein